MGKRGLGLALIGGLVLALAGCGQTVRPVVPPVRPAPFLLGLADPVAVPTSPPLAYDLGGLAAGGPSVTAESAILVDLGSGRVLWSKDPFSRRSIASLTKLTTAMVALDAAPPGRVVTVPPELASPRPGQTLLGVEPGQSFTVSELIQAMFVYSANDAAETLARTLEPRDRFVADMNAKAEALHLVGTHYSNPSGLEGQGHFSTAYDLAVLGGWLLSRYPVAAALAGSREMHLPALAEHPAFDGRSVNGILFTYQGATGLKTGYTFRAGWCEMATATRNGRTLLAVTLHSSPGGIFDDAGRVLDFGWTQP